MPDWEVDHRVKNTVSQKEKLNLSHILLGVAIGDA